MQQIGKLLPEVEAKIMRLKEIGLTKQVSVEKSFHVCPTCKFELSKESEHGWLNAGFDETTHRTIVIPCPTCSKNARARMESSAQADLVSRLFGGSHIPHRMRHYTFASYPDNGDQNAKHVAMRFVEQALAGNEDMQRGLFLGGLPGRGKTGLAVCVLKAALEVGQTGLFVMSLDLLHRIKATFNKETGVSSDELLDVVCRVPWLVLDDLAVERGTDFALEQLYFLIEQRRAKGLFTIFTSNLSTRDLEAYWRPKGTPEGAFHAGMRIVERIREYCLGVIVQGENLREGEW
jgi:DNA replication protein DnaC